MKFIGFLKAEEIVEFVYKSIADGIDGALTIIFDNKATLANAISDDIKQDFYNKLLLASIVSKNISNKWKTLEWLKEQKDTSLLRRNRKMLESNLDPETKSILQEYYPNSKIFEKYNITTIRNVLI